MTQTLGKTMKAVAIDRFGGVETLQTQELPIPAVGDDEVLIHVEAAGVGVWDPFEREGGFAKEFNIKPVFPLVLGSDGAGTVEAVGPQVKRFKNGDRVYGISFLNPKGGFYAQYAVVKETSLALIPGKLTMPQAAAMAVDAVTALAGLETTLGLKNEESLSIFWDPDHLVAAVIKKAETGGQLHPDCCEHNGFLWDLTAAYTPGSRWSENLPEPVLFNGTMVQNADALEMIVAKAK